MAAYDFEEAFKDNSSPKNDVVVSNKEAEKAEKIKHLTVSDKSEILSQKNSDVYKKINLSSIINVDSKEDEDDYQKNLRTSLAGEFLNYINPEIKKNFSFKFSRVDFKSFLILPAALTIILSLFMTGGFLFLATILFPVFLYLQVSDSAQMSFFEKNIWNSIDAIPEEKLKTILHSILSNNLVEDMYDEEEIKEIIFNYMYNDNKDAKTNAQHKIRENLRAISKASKNILNHQMMRA